MHAGEARTVFRRLARDVIEAVP